MIAEPAADLPAADAAFTIADDVQWSDINLKPFSFATIAAALALAGSPAFAGQFRQAADNAQVDCVASARELTRISLIADAFASVSKITTGYPYNDFTVTNEPVRGDIYISVPDGFAPGRVTFFATSKKGFVYKFTCKVAGDEAEQVFVSNPAIAGERAQSWEAKSTPRDAAVRLIQAMATSAVPDGFQVRQAAAAPTRIGDLSVRLIAEYRGARLTGKVLRIDNRAATAVVIDPAAVAPNGSLAISIGATELAPHGAATMYLVQDAGAGE